MLRNLSPFEPPSAGFPTLVYAMWMAGVGTVLLLVGLYLGRQWL